ncbi:hypothetical protein ADUPG1_001001 [Aduncisulcus paluster]|uniref:Uncharacterized protein n=1 Tax=Aduncisulcus paluster TaxID=2918883 RepID=A0ABQ5K8Y5_9EUKA|nr:hypothetical protein ADUPG1_001001 [Aduncisulcus paluster]
METTQSILEEFIAKHISELKFLFNFYSGTSTYLSGGDFMKILDDSGLFSSKKITRNQARSIFESIVFKSLQQVRKPNVPGRSITVSEIGKNLFSTSKVYHERVARSRDVVIAKSFDKTYSQLTKSKILEERERSRAFDRVNPPDASMFAPSPQSFKQSLISEMPSHAPTYLLGGKSHSPARQITSATYATRALKSAHSRSSHSSDGGRVKSYLNLRTIPHPATLVQGDLDNSKSHTGNKSKQSLGTAISSSDGPSSSLALQARSWGLGGPLYIEGNGSIGGENVEKVLASVRSVAGSTPVARTGMSHELKKKKKREETLEWKRKRKDQMKTIKERRKHIISGEMVKPCDIATREVYSATGRPRPAISRTSSGNGSIGGENVEKVLASVRSVAGSTPVARTGMSHELKKKKKREETLEWKRKRKDQMKTIKERRKHIISGEMVKPCDIATREVYSATGRPRPAISRTSSVSSHSASEEEHSMSVHEHSSSEEDHSSSGISGGLSDSQSAGKAIEGEQLTKYSSFPIHSALKSSSYQGHSTDNLQTVTEEPGMGEYNPQNTSDSAREGYAVADEETTIPSSIGGGWGRAATRASIADINPSSASKQNSYNRIHSRTPSAHNPMTWTYVPSTSSSVASIKSGQDSPSQKHTAPGSQTPLLSLHTHSVLLSLCGNAPAIPQTHEPASRQRGEFSITQSQKLTTPGTGPTVTDDGTVQYSNAMGRSVSHQSSVAGGVSGSMGVAEFEASGTIAEDLKHQELLEKTGRNVDETVIEHDLKEAHAFTTLQTMLTAISGSIGKGVRKTTGATASSGLFGVRMGLQTSPSSGKPFPSTSESPQAKDTMSGASSGTLTGSSTQHTVDPVSGKRLLHQGGYISSQASASLSPSTGRYPSGSVLSTMSGRTEKSGTSDIRSGLTTHTSMNTNDVKYTTHTDTTSWLTDAKKISDKNLNLLQQTAIEAATQPPQLPPYPVLDGKFRLRRRGDGGIESGGKSGLEHTHNDISYSQAPDLVAHTHDMGDGELEWYLERVEGGVVMRMSFSEFLAAIIEVGAKCREQRERAAKHEEEEEMKSGKSSISIASEDLLSHSTVVSKKTQKGVTVRQEMKLSRRSMSSSALTSGDLGKENSIGEEMELVIEFNHVKKAIPSSMSLSQSVMDLVGHYLLPTLRHKVHRLQLTKPPGKMIGNELTEVSMAHYKLLKAHASLLRQVFVMLGNLDFRSNKGIGVTIMGCRSFLSIFKKTRVISSEMPIATVRKVFYLCSRKNSLERAPHLDSHLIFPEFLVAIVSVCTIHGALDGKEAGRARSRERRKRELDSKTRQRGSTSMEMAKDDESSSVKTLRKFLALLKVEYNHEARLIPARKLPLWPQLF